MLPLLAFLLSAQPVPAAAAETEDVASCPGPAVGFLPNSDRFNPGTEQALDGIVAHMNSPLWRHGWFSFEPTVRDTRDRAVMTLVRRRQQTVRQAFTRRGIAPARIRFGSAHANADSGLEDTFIILSNVPGSIWRRMVDPGIVC